MGISMVPLLFALTQGVLSPISANLGPSAPLDRGYRQMYNLEFSEAHNTFQTYAKAHPGDPFGSTSDGAAYLFEEFNRLGVLQTELFTDNDKFKDRARSLPDPRVREQFDGAIAQRQKLAGAKNSQYPTDPNAHDVN